MDEKIKLSTRRGEKEELDEQSVLTGIDCLLQMQNNLHPARFGGATNPAVSQLFPPATANVTALYYISYLYFGKWDHADAVALRDEAGKIDRPEAIDLAYKSYRSWFDEVKSIGLAKARELKLDPLKDTKVHWY